MLTPYFPSFLLQNDTVKGTAQEITDVTVTMAVMAIEIEKGMAANVMGLLDDTEIVTETETVIVMEVAETNMRIIEEGGMMTADVTTEAVEVAAEVEVLVEEERMNSVGVEEVIADITGRMVKEEIVEEEIDTEMVWEPLKGALQHRRMQRRSHKEKEKPVAGMFMHQVMSNTQQCRRSRQVRCRMTFYRLFS